MGRKKTERIEIPKGAQDSIRPLLGAIHERILGMRLALNVPEGWQVEHDRTGIPLAFVPPKAKE